MTTTIEPPVRESAAKGLSPEELRRLEQSVRDRTPFPVPSEEAFRDPDWDPADGWDPEENEDDWPQLDFLPAADLQRIASDLITGNTGFNRLAGLRLEYRWKRTGGRSKGKATLSRTTKPSGLFRHFTGLDFVIWLAADHARDLALTHRQIEAALFHELCHCQVDDDSKPTLTLHDFEGFGAELRAYGAWTASLRAAERHFRQLRLDLDGDAHE